MPEQIDYTKSPPIYAITVVCVVVAIIAIVIYILYKAYSYITSPSEEDSKKKKEGATDRPTIGSIYDDGSLLANGGEANTPKKKN